jgi:Tfp pilus assembly protein FimV
MSMQDEFINGSVGHPGCIARGGFANIEQAGCPYAESLHGPYSSRRQRLPAALSVTGFSMGNTELQPLRKPLLNRLRTFLVAASAFPVAQLACAADLGPLTVRSTLGQPLNAEIELITAQNDDLPKIVARLASPKAHEVAGLPYHATLATLRTTLEKRPNGRMYLRAITPLPVSELFLEFIVELAWQNGLSVRQYTAIIDPPGYDSTDEMRTWELSP